MFFAATGFADWTYDSGTKVLTEVVDSGTAWAITCSASGTDLTLSSIKTKGLDAEGNAKKLDLNTTIADGYKIVNISRATNLFQKRAAGFATEIVLPKTLTTITSWAFQECKNTITLPEDNELVTLGDAAFTSSYLSGRVYLPKIVTLYGNDGAGPFNDCDSLLDLDIGPNCYTTASYGNLAKNCNSITSLTCRAVSFTVKSWSLQNDKNLKTFTFYAKPTLNDNWASGITFDKKTRLFVKKDEDSWIEMMQGSKFTAWEKADQTTYFANFGADAQIPLGYTTDPFTAYVLEVPEQKVAGAKVKVAYSPAQYGEPEPGYGDKAGLTAATTFTLKRAVESHTETRRHGENVV